MNKEYETAYDRAQTLLDVTTKLNALFDRENAILENGRPSELLPLQSEKARLASAYAQLIRDVAQNRAEMQAIDERLLEEIKAITSAFEERAQHQRALLDGARRANEGVVNAISQEATAKTQPASYNVKASVTSAPISINENA